MEQEIPKKYELVVIVDAKASGETKEGIRKQVAELITKHGGRVINSQVWLDRHKMTFKIKKCDEGTYYLINFEGPGSVVGKVKPVLRINESVLRFAFYRIESKTGAKKPAAAARA